MPRDHRLRERRLKLGLTQREVGELAGILRWPANIVGLIERGQREDWNHLVRRALIYREQSARRLRAWERQEVTDLVALAHALESDPETDRDAVIVDRLVDLLHSGRTDDFDALAAIVGEALARVAGDRYLDECTPVLPAES